MNSCLTHDCVCVMTHILDQAVKSLSVKLHTFSSYVFLDLCPDVSVEKETSLLTKKIKTSAIIEQ